jgi:hypothetical protein
MRRRDFIKCAGSVVAWPLPLVAHAQQAALPLIGLSTARLAKPMLVGAERQPAHRGDGGALPFAQVPPLGSSKSPN